MWPPATTIMNDGSVPVENCGTETMLPPQITSLLIDNDALCDYVHEYDDEPISWLSAYLEESVPALPGSLRAVLSQLYICAASAYSSRSRISLMVTADTSSTANREGSPPSECAGAAPGAILS